MLQLQLISYRIGNGIPVDNSTIVLRFPRPGFQRVRFASSGPLSALLDAASSLTTR